MNEVIKIEDTALKVQTSTSSKGFQQKFRQLKDCYIFLKNQPQVVIEHEDIKFRN